MEYRTDSGLSVRIGKIDRRIIDKFLVTKRPPEPPIVEINTAFGVEEVKDYDDIEYQKMLNDFYQELADNEFQLVAQALEIFQDNDSEEDEISLVEAKQLASINLLPSKNNAPVGERLTRLEKSLIVGEVFYNSTVTTRGINEALNTFDVRWLGNKVRPSFIGEDQKDSQMISSGHSFSDMKAALYCNHTWQSFCDLHGYEQSWCVAYYWLDMKIKEVGKRKR